VTPALADLALAGETWARRGVAAEGVAARGVVAALPARLGVVGAEWLRPGMELLGTRLAPRPGSEELDRLCSLNALNRSTKMLEGSALCEEGCGALEGTEGVRLKAPAGEPRDGEAPWRQLCDLCELGCLPISSSCARLSCSKSLSR